MASVDIQSLAESVYKKCLDQFSASQLLYQRDILGLGLIPNKSLEILLQCTQLLVDQNYFGVYQDAENRLSWKVIPREDAERIQGLSDNEQLVYKAIHSTQRNGIWIRALGKRTDLPKTTLDKALKALEGKNFIKSIHNVKHPGKKVYMLAGLTPAEEVTGGAWFTDGVLDAEFIGALSNFIEDWVSKRSWYESASSKQSGKRKKLNSGESVKTDSEKIFLPYPADYQYYPTVEDITTEVNKIGITPVKLDRDSTEQLLQMMCFDGRLVALGGSYKSLRRPDAVAKYRVETNRIPEIQLKSWIGTNGMTEAPCGQCPVFKLCQPGGKVSPDTCEYFDKWLEDALGF
ncbi:DNA-directed RNA polymerase III subunit C34 [Talaromyces islandicus]|uniref:DNA-directed RNA polymerase III subunit RPC6 n=1 Tax=Talaromyces islandicus TaxID=28573 RepID=A0A0U1M4E1_TALIS|nr:DNA-directed RNA polymerase III subunit C34 [Talaromyces islandicus]